MWADTPLVRAGTCPASTRLNSRHSAQESASEKRWYFGSLKEIFLHARICTEQDRLRAAGKWTSAVETPHGTAVDVLGGTRPNAPRPHNSTTGGAAIDTSGEPAVTEARKRDSDALITTRGLRHRPQVILIRLPIRMSGRRTSSLEHPPSSGAAVPQACSQSAQDVTTASAPTAVRKWCGPKPVARPNPHWGRACSRRRVPWRWTFLRGQTSLIFSSRPPA